MSKIDGDDSLICPITQEYFRDPVIAEDGRLYEREAITRWINEHGTSPFTREVLNVNHLQPDDVIRKRAEQRRRLSVSYNRESDQIHLPSIRTTHDIHMNMITNRENPHRTIGEDFCCQNMRSSQGSTIRSSFLSKRLNFVICISGIICLLMPVIIVSIALGVTRSRSSITPIRYTTTIPLCTALNYNLTTNSCISLFTNLTTIYSGICNTFMYRRLSYRFNVLSSTTNIIFAFQQTTGYWDIDNITFSNSTFIQNLFRNGDFETGSLSPDYRQCQSTGNISNSSQFNGRYCYSDGTRGQFGYLMQNVLTTPGQSYYLSFYLRNRIGSNSSFMVIVGS